MTDFENKVFEKINEYKMLDGISRVTAALSGGADSMSLLHFLVKHAEEIGITVRAAHVNHNLRGEEALRDLRFVEEQCRRLSVELCVKSADVAALASQRGIGTEECGRQVRYEFFSTLRAGNKNEVTATAHTASDNAETVLLNITRGCGINGLCGIPAVRDGIIRPLLGCTRIDIEDYCKENNIEYITDSTNLTDEYSRNRIRLNVLPQLNMINPSAVTAINRLSSIASAEKALIRRITDSEIARCTGKKGLDIGRLRQCDPDIMSYVIIDRISEILGVTPEKRHCEIVRSIILSGSGALEIKKNRMICAEDGELRFIETDAINEKPSEIFPERQFEYGDSFLFNGKQYSVSQKTDISYREKHKINKKLLINRLPCDIITCGTTIRTRRGGDVFSPYGRGCTKSVKKLFSEMKIPLSERDKILLAANGSRVIWIEGIGVSQDAAESMGESYVEIKVGMKNDQGS